MKLTWIDDDNVKFFKNVIGDRYLKKKEGEIFAGVIDDAGTAVGAGVFLSQPETLSIEFLAVTDERRRQGIGSFLLDGMTDAARKLDFKYIDAVFYAAPKDEGADILKKFLIANGFRIELIDAKRTVYELDKVLALPDFSEKKENTYVIKPASELTEKEREAVLALENRGIDVSELLSFGNRYGGFLFDGETLKAALYVERFSEGVRIGTLFGDGEAQFVKLFDYAKETVNKNAGAAKELYIDTVGEKTFSYMEKLLEKAGITPKEQFQACGAQRVIGI